MRTVGAVGVWVLEFLKANRSERGTRGLEAGVSVGGRAGGLGGASVGGRWGRRGLRGVACTGALKNHVFMTITMIVIFIIAIAIISFF